ncbi:exopolysaccharide Pel transporter PelG [Bacillus sp. Marseille-P3661]|uniref:exopolysaccharide Pel transporter PelG n=1 Tax=Bacillus sp. Marseille-P3661 TaxID=1936234 RepID=UPI000C83DA8F|nr:exopolysaccharide Pel transporter PelG [Bacillus sp. Marseille-P3661]
MAGIGFQLKELFQKSGIIKNVRAFSYSTIVTVGPMFFCVVLITLAKHLLGLLNTVESEIDRFMAGIEYAFIFSQIITGGFSFTISRFIADQSFLEKDDYILSSMIGLISICVSIGGISTFIFYYNSPLPLAFKICSYLFFSELIIIWIQAMYVSAIKDYIRIVKSFIVGFFISALLFWICIIMLELNNATTVFICLDVGFFFIIMRLNQFIRSYFTKNNQEYFRFLIYLEKYPFLFFTGFFYIGGLYSHNLIIWQGNLNIVVDQTFKISPYYDVPVFFSYITVLPAMVLFMIYVETSFYQAHKEYYHRILHSYPLREILDAKKNMFKVLSTELTFLAEIQLIVVLCSITIGSQLLPRFGMTSEQLHLFMILTLGNLFFSLLFTMIILLLYYDDQFGAFLTTAIFFLVSTLFTAIFMLKAVYGFPIFLASFISLCVAIYKLINYVNNIDYYTFCSQPVIFVDKKTWIEGFLIKFRHIK